MSQSHDFADPGRFTVGAMGQPAQRVFYFQAFADGTEVALKCEKQQAQALAGHLIKLLDDLPSQASDVVNAAEALPPTEITWTVGSISIGVDRGEGRIVVMLEELVIPDDPDEPTELEAEPAHLRVRLTPDQVKALAAQVEALVTSSRPLCRLCERPIDPSGHACPRLN